MSNGMDKQLVDAVIEEVDEGERIDLIKEILRYEKAKLGLAHRKGKVEKIRNEIQNYLKEKGEIL